MEAVNGPDEANNPEAANNPEEMHEAEEVHEAQAASEPVGRPRHERSLTESLLSIVLGLEAFLVFFVTMAVFGLRTLDPVVAFSGGGALILLLVLATRVLRYPWGVWAGWGLQAILLATGILLPIMFAVAAGFIGLWIFCFVKGRQIDERNRESRAARSGGPDSSGSAVTSDSAIDETDSDTNKEHP